MKRVILICALVAICAGQDQAPIEPAFKTTTQPPPSPTTTKSPPSPTTTKPPPPSPTTTKPPPPSPTTTKPPTPSPTTPKPPPPSPTTTNPPPTLPTTKPPPTTPAPIPPTPVPPSQGTWDVKEGNSTCIRIQGAIQISIPYTRKSQNATYNATVDIPKDAKVSDGNCNKGDMANITIQWMNANNQTDHIKFAFWQNVTTEKYELHRIELQVYPDDVTFPGIDDKSEIWLEHDRPEFSVHLSQSYKCEIEQKLNLTDSKDKSGRGFICVSKLQMQAFGNLTTDGFGSPMDCETSGTPDVVPIAVGCALAILVIVVLIAYLIGRRRRQARGYLSM